MPRNPHLDEGVHIGHVKVIHLTDKALLVEIEGDTDDKRWVPKGQLHPDGEIKDYALVNEEGELVITDWLKSKWDKES